jgi:hypothetical protein
MHGGHYDGRERGFQELPAMLGDAKAAAEQRLRCGGAKTNDYFGMERGDFGIEPRPASCYFPGARFFVDAAFSARFLLKCFTALVT